MLINHYVPVCQFRERHDMLVDASPAMLLDAVSEPGITDDPWMRTFIRMREFPERFLSRLTGGGELQGKLPFGFDNFLLLGRDGDREIALGLLGKFWQFDYGQVRVPDAAAFHRFDVPGVAKLVLNLSAEKMDGGRTRLATETRIFCNDRKSTLSFTPYWWLIRPVSGLIRRRLLARIARQAASVADVKKGV